MSQQGSIQDRVNGAFGELSAGLQTAARFVVENPIDVATRSLRSVAGSSGVSPATLSRLARALGYTDYEQLRQAGRDEVAHRISPFSERAQAFRQEADGQQGEDFLANQSAACIANIARLSDLVDARRLEQAVDLLHGARSVTLIGSMGSAGIVDYMGYLGQWFNGTWRVAGRNGVELSSTLSRLGEQDVVLVLSKAPYARRTVGAAKAARAKGAKTIAITDSLTSPVLQFATHGFVLATDSPHFFSSYAASLVLMETMISMLLARAGPDAEGMIRAAEAQIERLGENWTP